MKKNDPLGRYPYRCPDCPTGKPFRRRVSYARHRQLRHPAPDVDPRVYDPNPAPIAAIEAAYREPLDLGGFGHGNGALPTLDDYDGARR